MISVEVASLPTVRAVFTHPDVWPWIHDDAAPAVEDWQPMDHPVITYLAVMADGVLVGCVMLYPLNHATYELHSALLPQGRGHAVEAVARITEWLWANTPAATLLTWVPAYNLAADKAARKSGFTERTRLPASYRKDGVLHDLTLFGVAKCPQ